MDARLSAAPAEKHGERSASRTSFIAGECASAGGRAPYGWIFPSAWQRLQASVAFPHPTGVPTHASSLLLDRCCRAALRVLLGGLRRRGDGLAPGTARL